MLLPILAIAIALTVPSTQPPQPAWLPSQIAIVEASTVDPGGQAQAWRILHDPTTVRTAIAPGAADRTVEQLQRHLAGLGVFRGDPDGAYGREVAAAVIAVHKLAETERSNAWSADDWDIVLDHSAILARHADEPDRIEVDIARQVMFVIRGEAVAAIIPVSSGNGERYWSKNGGPGGGLVRASTPKGDFTIFRHVDGWRKNYLGSLYKPWYFTPYYAVHGSSRVPAHPASHGCVRVPTWESDHLDALLELGLPIHIWDGRWDELPADYPSASGPNEYGSSSSSV